MTSGEFLLDTMVLLLMILQLLPFLGHSGTTSELRDTIPAGVYGTCLVCSVSFTRLYYSITHYTAIRAFTLASGYCVRIAEGAILHVMLVWLSA
jgi:hypothetical protein